MTNPTEPGSTDVETLDHLLELALDLDEEARINFLTDASVPAHLREELTALLKAAVSTGALDRPPAAGMLASSQQAVAAGQALGHYRLVRLLGEGGMASVWLAERRDLGHQVAVKCLKTGLATDEGRARFLREQRLLAQLQHPNIARLYDAGISSDGVPFIVMEWVNGFSITRYCDERKLGLPQRLRLFQKICAAVAYAHQNLVVHRDLKPANILVGADDEPKLLDFGIAKLLDESAEPVTRTGLYLLTPEYAAPEQFDNSTVTTATDTYALGALLYELLSGLRPRPKANRFTKESAAAVVEPSEALRRLVKKSRVKRLSLPWPKRNGNESMVLPEPLENSTASSAEARKPRLSPDAQQLTQIAEQRATTPERLRRTLHGDLDTIALKALQAEPARRYATAQAFCDDVEHYLRQQPIQARKDTWAYRTSKYLARHAVGVTLSCLVAIVLLAATAVSMNQAHRAEIQTLRAQTEARRADAEARRAQSEAKRATAVKEFLTNLFEVSDSGVPRDRMPTTEALLEDGAKRIRSEFSDAPEIKFDLLLLLGGIQLTHFRYEQAEALLKEAKTIADRTFSPADEKWLQAQTEWGNLLGRNGDYDAALGLLTTAIEQYQQASGHKQSGALVKALAAQGTAYRRLGRFDDAVAALRAALAVDARAPKQTTSQTPMLQSLLAEALFDAERHDEAEAMLRKNLVLRRELYGEYNVKYGRGVADLASTLTKQGKHAEAEQLARKALAIYESVYSPQDVLICAALYPLGSALLNQQKWEDAKAVYRRIEMLQTQLGRYDPVSAAAVIANLAVIAQAQGRYRDAEQLRRRYLALAKEKFGPLHFRTARGLRALAETLISQRRLPEAIELNQEALAIDLAVYGEDTELVGDSLYNLGVLQREAGNWRQGVDYIDRAIRVYAKVSTVDNPRQTMPRVEKAILLNKLRRYGEAKELLVPLIERMRKTPASPGYDLADALTELGRAQAGLGARADALRHWQEALVLQRAKQVPDPGEIPELEELISQIQK